MKKVLVTCPPMIAMLSEFIGPARELGIDLVAAETTQVLTEAQLIELLPAYNGWIIGDDPASYRVFKAGCLGNLEAAVKWGVGVDNVDFQACKKLQIPITNTPNMFGGEVADLAIGLMLGLARQSYFIDREIRNNFSWPKPAGISMAGKKVGIVGFGDIGFNTAKRLMGFDVSVIVYDPKVNSNLGLDYVTHHSFPEELDQLDFVIFTCSLNQHNLHMLNAQTINKLKQGVKIINVARGALIDELALISALESGKVSAAALDVFEHEPLPEDSPLRAMPQCIFGSHNGSNTTESVSRASAEALQHMASFLYG